MKKKERRKCRAVDAKYGLVKGYTQALREVLKKGIMSKSNKE